MEGNGIRMVKCLLKRTGLLEGRMGALGWFMLVADAAFVLSSGAEAHLARTFDDRLKATFLFVGSTHIFSKHLNMFWKRTQVAELIGQMERMGLVGLEDGKKAVHVLEAERVSARVIALFGGSLLVVFLVTFGASLVAHLAGSLARLCLAGHRLTSLGLPFPLWTPFRPETDFLLAYTWQLVMTPAFVIYLLSVAILVTAAMNITAQIRILTEDLTNIPVLNTPDKNEALRKCIILHNDIIGLIDKANGLLSNVLALELVINTIQSCLATYQTIKLNSNFSNTLYNNTNLIVILTSPFMICWIGSEVETKYCEISRAAYNSSWFEQTKEIKKKLYTIMLIASKPKTINYKQVFLINMKRYTEVLQTAYSYYTVVQSLEK